MMSMPRLPKFNQMFSLVSVVSQTVWKDTWIAILVRLKLILSSKSGLLRARSRSLKTELMEWRRRSEF
jgi:hypothetical protein